MSEPPKGGKAPTPRASSPAFGSPSRSYSNARLGSPIPTPGGRSPRRRSNSEDNDTVPPAPLAGPPPTTSRTASGPGHSALTDALSTSAQNQVAPSSPIPTPVQVDEPQATSNYGSLAPPSGRGSPGPGAYEDFDVVRRHLVGPVSEASPSEAVTQQSSQKGSNAGQESQKDQEIPEAPAVDEDEFSSLKLQGGDITRDIYRRAEAETSNQRSRTQRSNSWMAPQPDPVDETLDYSNIHQPGGFRRHHLRQSANSPRPSHRSSLNPQQVSEAPTQPGFLTRNFFEFLSLYGHFAGEEPYDDDDESEVASTSQYDPSHDRYGSARAARETGERAPLLKRQSYKKQQQSNKPKSGTAGTIFILLKSFVGTGVLFLPRAFLNGGMYFSVVTMVIVSALSYFCFILLTTSRLTLKRSYAEMGEMMYGKPLRSLINISLVVSQMGFASAYIVFVSENLRAFTLAVSRCKTDISLKLMIFIQLIIFMPLSLYRNLNNISYIVYIADIFIVLGLVYLYYTYLSTIVDIGGVADIIHFNSSTWTLFIGTAVFTFEGIGLLIPIQDGMKKPQQLPSILGLVMCIITVIFVSSGAFAYAAYGSKTETVILLNMNQENKFVNGVQFVYSLAILLSTPMQIFPAITITENAIFSRSGKYDKDIKWRKNIWRFGVVMCSAIIAWIGANDLDKFVSLTGSFACIPLVYIYPPLIHRKSTAKSQLSRMVDLALVFLGVALMTYTSAITIQSWATGTKETPLRYCDRIRE